ncbi:hypothetical protein ACIQLK_03930 [Microbacterium sp. NPDC091382]|uniref:hypothetical protein n=1 Tax=Microbacterium sp. NPDC091382 TaxID=3364210 RepID=UPI00381ED300
MRTRLLSALAGTALVALALAACATPGAGDADPGTVAGETAPAWAVGAGWLDGGRTIALVTWGSSSCVPAVDETRLDGSTFIVSLRGPEPGPCTDDLVARGLEVPVPQGVDPADGLSLRVSLGPSRADVDLAAHAGGQVEEFTPEAAWVGDRTIALRTWGSSTCPPIVADTREESPASVIVSFAKLDADRACTADVAPQLTVVQLDPDAVVDRDATLSFGVTGSDETVPIR